jgi:hypothetical protein
LALGALDGVGDDVAGGLVGVLMVRRFLGALVAASDDELDVAASDTDEENIMRDIVVLVDTNETTLRPLHNHDGGDGHMRNIQSDSDRLR